MSSIMTLQQLEIRIKEQNALEQGYAAEMAASEQIDGQTLSVDPFRITGHRMI